MWGEKDIRMVSTVWFDIIYPARSAESALKLYESADAIYAEICADHGTEPQFRMTVTLSPSTDVLNAYFTNYSANHIVVHDAVPIEDLAVFESGVEDVFRHELTHAVTINMRSPFWKTLASIMGDAYNLGTLINMPSMIKEGASVVEESRSGDGRLNDGFFMHAYRQALLQGDFPSYTQVTGAGDIFSRSGICYDFGGPFSEWLQNEYGREKYARFWYEGINMGGLTYEWVFRKVYGFSFSDAWEAFKSSIRLPDIPASPDSIDGVDFYGNGKSSGAFYASLTSSVDGIAWIDSASSSVHYAPWTDGGIGKSRKLFAMRNVSSIRLSNDGRFMVVCSVGINHGSSRTEAHVYDMKSKSMKKVPALSIRDGAVIESGGEKYLCMVSTECSSCAFSVWKMNLGKKDGSLRSLDYVGRFGFSDGQTVFSPVDAGNGRLAFILKDGKIWSVCIMPLMQDFDSFSALELPFEEGRSIRNLSVGYGSSDECRDRLNLSWAERDVFPRLAVLDFEEDSCRISSMVSDVSGGVYNPVSSPDSKGAFFVHIGKFFAENEMVVSGRDAVALEEKSVQLKVRNFGGVKNRHEGESDGSGLHGDESGSTSLSVSDFLSRSRKYHGGLLRGCIFPFSTVPVYTVGAQSEKPIYFPGISCIWMNPWDGITLEIMGGVNPGTVPFSFFQDDCLEAGLALRIKGGTSTPLFNYSILAQTAFDSNGYMQSAVELEMTSILTFGRISFLSFRNEFLAFYGRDLSYCGDERFLTLSDRLETQVGLSFKTGAGTYQSFKAALLATLDFFSMNQLDGGYRGIENSVYAFPTLLLKLPNLLPLSCPEAFTFNLPAEFCLSWAPSKSQVLGAYVTAVLFNWEIQNGPRYVPVYFNRLGAKLSYVCGLLDPSSGVNPLNVPAKLADFSSLIYADSVRLSAMMDFTVNTGSLANPQGMISLAATLNLYPHKSEGEKPFSLSFDMSLNF